MATSKPSLSPVSVRRITLARYYYTLAREHARSDRENDAFVAINLLHEALETFLVAAAEHLNVALKPRSDFSTYLDKIDEAIVPARLPFRTALNRLNKARVHAKHDSVVPDRSELPNFVASAGSFLEEAAQQVFALDFSSVSLVDLISAGEVKDCLAFALGEFIQSRYSNVLVACRQALYLTFEHGFDVSGYADGATPQAFLNWICKAPHYSRSPAWIEENVREPFDYVVLDHSRLDDEMIKDGLDPHIYWNLWRLTPQVYKAASGEWLVRNEPDKFSEDTARTNAPYVLEQTIDLIHRRERKRLAIRTVQPGLWQLRVRTPGACIYHKATRASVVVSTIPPDVTHVQVQNGTPALDGNGHFWRVVRNELMQGENWFSGYIHAEDLERE